MRFIFITVVRNLGFQLEHKLISGADDGDMEAFAPSSWAMSLYGRELFI